MELLKYDEFKKVVEERLEEYLPAGYGVKPSQVTVNNREWDNIVLYKNGEEPGNGLELKAGIRILLIYDKYVDSQGDLESVLKEAAEHLMEKDRIKPEIPADAMNIEVVKSNIICSLVNTKENAEMLLGVPHREMLDLSIVYRWFLIPDHGRLVDYKMLDYLGMSEEELYMLACENTIRIYPPIISTMGEMLVEEGLPDTEKKMFENSMLFIYNRQAQYGASYMLFKPVLQHVAEKLGGSFYIFPSSVHELVAVPADRTHLEEYQGMVKEINRSQGLIGTDNFLSDKVYHYNAETKEVSIA